MVFLDAPVSCRVSEKKLKLKKPSWKPDQTLSQLWSVVLSSVSLAVAVCFLERTGEKAAAAVLASAAWGRPWHE